MKKREIFIFLVFGILLAANLVLAATPPASVTAPASSNSGLPSYDSAPEPTLWDAIKAPFIAIKSGVESAVEWVYGGIQDVQLPFFPKKPVDKTASSPTSPGAYAGPQGNIIPEVLPTVPPANNVPSQITFPVPTMPGVDSTTEGASAGAGSGFDNTGALAGAGVPGLTSVPKVPTVAVTPADKELIDKFNKDPKSLTQAEIKQMGDLLAKGRAAFEQSKPLMAQAETAVNNFLAMKSDCTPPPEGPNYCPQLEAQLKSSQAQVSALWSQAKAQYAQAEQQFHLQEVEWAKLSASLPGSTASASTLAAPTTTTSAPQTGVAKVVDAVANTVKSAVASLANKIKARPSIITRSTPTRTVTLRPGQGISKIISMPTIVQLTTSAQGYTSEYDSASSSFIISADGSQPLGGIGPSQGEADKLPPPNPSSTSGGFSMPSANQTNATKENVTSECTDPSGICIVTPFQNSIVSLTAAKDLGSQLQILTTNQLKCRYSLTSSDFNTGEFFLEDQGGTSIQHTIYLYYLGEMKLGKYSVYEKCQDLSGGNKASATHVFTVSSSGIDCSIKENGTGATAEVFTDPVSGQESCKVIPMATANLTVGDKNVTLVVEKNGQPIKEIPLAAKMEATGNAFANAPAPTQSTGASPLVLGGLITVLAGLSLGLVYLIKSFTKLKAPGDIPVASYPTVADQMASASEAQ